MEAPESSELRLRGSKDDAVAAIRDALPGDAVVRAEDDGVGRFASERTVMVIGPGERRLMLYQGGWRFVRAREGKPQLDVAFVEGDDGLTARLTRAPEEKPGLRSHVFGVVGNVATVTLLVIAYHLFQKIPIDTVLVAAIGVGGGVLWSAVAHFWPQKQDAGLDAMVRGALEPLVDGADDGDGERDEDDDEEEEDGDEEEEDGDQEEEGDGER